MQICCLSVSRVAWWKSERNAAAWTGTHTSFIQEFVSKVPPDAGDISRDDECWLMYLSHGTSNVLAHHFLFGPFGPITIEDTTLDVRVLGPPLGGISVGGF